MVQDPQARLDGAQNRPAGQMDSNPGKSMHPYDLVAIKTQCSQGIWWTWGPSGTLQTSDFKLRRQPDQENWDFQGWGKAPQDRMLAPVSEPSYGYPTSIIAGRLADVSVFLQCLPNPTAIPLCTMYRSRHQAFTTSQASLHFAPGFAWTGEK